MVFISKSNIQRSREAIVLLSSQLSLGSMRTSLLLPERRLSSSHGVCPSPTDQSVSCNVSSHPSVKTCLLDSFQLSASESHSEVRTSNLYSDHPDCFILQGNHLPRSIESRSCHSSSKKIHTCISQLRSHRFYVVLSCI
jgi:hypothetical protein